MLKKEFRDTLRILLESSLLLLSIPLIILATLIMGIKMNYWLLIKMISIFTVFAFAGYSGLGIFLWEKRDYGFEYLLTLPMSRLKLLIYKLLPRMILLILLLWVWGLFFTVPIKEFFLVLLFIQGAGACLSLAFNSFFAALIGIILLGFFYSLFYRFANLLFYYWQRISIDPLTTIPTDILAALSIGIPLVISFILALKNFDLKPYQYTVRPYLFIAMPLLLVQAAVIFLFYTKVASILY